MNMTQVANQTANHRVKSSLISIPLDDEEIRKMSQEISSEVRTWDDLVKLFAETELRLAPAFAKNDFRSTGNTRAIHLYPFKTVDIRPSYLREHPNENDVQKFADEIAAQNLPRHELHWFIAERKYIYRKVKEFI